MKLFESLKEFFSGKSWYVNEFDCFLEDDEVNAKDLDVLCVSVPECCQNRLFYVERFEILSSGALYIAYYQSVKDKKNESVREYIFAPGTWTKAFTTSGIEI